MRFHVNSAMDLGPNFAHETESATFCVSALHVFSITARMAASIASSVRRWAAAACVARISALDVIRLCNRVVQQTPSAVNQSAYPWDRNSWATNRTPATENIPCGRPIEFCLPLLLLGPSVLLQLLADRDLLHRHREAHVHACKGQGTPPLSAGEPRRSQPGDPATLSRGTPPLSAGGFRHSQPEDPATLSRGTPPLSAGGPRHSQPEDPATLSRGIPPLSAGGPCHSQPGDPVALSRGTPPLLAGGPRRSQPGNPATLERGGPVQEKRGTEGDEKGKQKGIQKGKQKGIAMLLRLFFTDPPALTASDWSIMRIYPRLLRLIGPS
eukprot:1188891-Prorocentrum_minimum.AAC.1